MLLTITAGKWKRIFLCSTKVFLQMVPFMRWRGKTWNNQTGHELKYNKVRALCILNICGCTNTHSEYVTIISFTATMVTQIFSSSTLYVHCLSSLKVHTYLEVTSFAIPMLLVSFHCTVYEAKRERFFLPYFRGFLHLAFYVFIKNVI